MTRRSARSLLSILVLLVAATYTWWESGRDATGSTPSTEIERPQSPPRSQRESTEVPPSSASARELTLDEVNVAEREELIETVRLIDAGGPFPYRKDGTTFRNAEGRLPRKEARYYREYTVRTPGSRDRGARRVVGGAEGELYYTSDHYRSFVAIRSASR